ncbi:hypothetical protein N866_08495 [Actinotalea ferrariae CF5-4]|uniref:Uncharacterized protein n=1 Tax=Actinotalea ferrariae CF5-4 TaxID=948458 RepID=A0A021VMM4_9CELL|nr:hypothetical protein N866_08495 [Actinotalea ferrariae CF5-4]
MSPVPTLELAPHVEPTCVEVNVGPRQPEHLAPPQAQRDREHERDTVRLALGRGEDPAGFVDGQGFDLGRVVPGRVRQRDGIAREAPSSNGVVEGLVERPAHVVDGAGVQAVGEQDGVEVLHVLGLERIEPVLADGGVDVAVDVDRVAGQGARSDPQLGGGQPLGQPCLEPR